MSKQVQVPMTLLVDIYRLLMALEDEVLVTGSDEIAERVKTQIDDLNINRGYYQIGSTLSNGCKEFYDTIRT